MYDIPANQKALGNAPNNVVHGKVLLIPGAPIANDGNTHSGTFVVPDGVYLLWISLVQSGVINGTGSGLGKVVVPMQVTPGEVINWFVAAVSGAATTFGQDARQISSVGGFAVGISGLLGAGWGSADGGTASGYTGNILVEW